MRVNGTASQVEVVIVGAGQAGLAVSYYLQAFGVEHVVLERGRVGESWRSTRWDSFTLVTPNWMNRLPGYRLAAGSAREFLARDTVVSLLDGFARGLPVQAATEVLSVDVGDGGYDVVTTAGRMAARAVVIASGGQRRPLIPRLSAALAADILQTHAGRYRRPDALPSGAILVVGSGQSGMQIATDLAAAGRDVLLATGQVARVPRRYRGRDAHEWAVELGLYDQPADAVSDPAEFRRPHPMLSGARGGQTLSYQQLARDGVRLLGRLAGADGYTLSFGPELPRNVEHADQGAAQFRRLVDEYVARAGIAAPPPDTDPAERPGSAPPGGFADAERAGRAHLHRAVVHRLRARLGLDAGPRAAAGRHGRACPRRHRLPRPVRGRPPVAVEPRLGPAVWSGRRRGPHRSAHRRGLAWPDPSGDLPPGPRGGKAIVMTTRKKTTLYYNGIVWQTVLTTDGKRVVRPVRLADGALPARPARPARLVKGT